MWSATCEEPAQHALDDGAEPTVLLGEALRVHPQELLEVLLDQPEERGLPRPTRPGEDGRLGAVPGRVRRTGPAEPPTGAGRRASERERRPGILPAGLGSRVAADPLLPTAGRGARPSRPAGSISRVREIRTHGLKGGFRSPA